MIDFEHFAAVDIRVGTIVSARLNEKAREPAFVMEIDFGGLGLKTSSAQITEHYDAESLIGMQIVAVTNFPAKRVAGVRSEVLVLASVSETGTILITPTKQVENGSPIS